MNGTMRFRLGNLSTDIIGGPYKDRLVGHVTVKMAQEINEPCTIDIPTKDFNVPNVAVFKRGLIDAIMAIHLGFPLYVGCWGGIGRTGLFLAGMAKVMTEYRKKMHRPQFDPVLYVRNEFIPHAVETKQQEEYIDRLFVGDIVEWWFNTQRFITFPQIEYLQVYDIGESNARQSDFMAEHQDEPNFDGPDDFECCDCGKWFPIDDLTELEDDELICDLCLEPGSDDDKYVVVDDTEAAGIGDFDLEFADIEKRLTVMESAARIDRLAIERDAIERLEGVVLELDRRIAMQEAAREQTLKDLVAVLGTQSKPWWAIWG